MLSQSTGDSLPSGDDTVKANRQPRTRTLRRRNGYHDAFMRVAWFSPLPPVRSGIAAYSADVLAALREDIAIDCFVDAAAQSSSVFNAHDFLWRHRRAPYDLTVYQLGNAPCHDYMWAYLAAFPGLVVLHDARLHHARARALLRRGRADDYRAEFCFDHPDAVADFAEYAVEGLSGPIYSFWSMLRVVMVTARVVAVHNSRVAADLRVAYPDAPVDTIRMGIRASPPRPGAAARIRRQLSVPGDATVFAAFGKMTSEKRIGPILVAFRELVAHGTDAYLMLIGDASEYPNLGRETAGLDRVRVAGHVDDGEIGDYLAACDVCLCLRWPTALETSASWLHCLAAQRATVITDLAHLADVPALDPRTWRSNASHPPMTVAIDLLDEERSLSLAMHRLAADHVLRGRIARHGHDYWARQHTPELMADDYRRLLRTAADRPAPVPTHLPAHLTRDYSEAGRELAHLFGADVDILRDVR
jgi:glycosyltransferase involved in cell wall biosynthesis